MEESKLMEVYQSYMENVKQQQDKIMKTASYKQTTREVDANDVDSGGAEVTATPGGPAATSQ